MLDYRGKNATRLEDLLRKLNEFPDRSEPRRITAFPHAWHDHESQVLRHGERDQLEAWYRMMFGTGFIRQEP